MSVICLLFIGYRFQWTKKKLLLHFFGFWMSYRPQYLMKLREASKCSDLIYVLCLSSYNVDTNKVNIFITDGLQKLTVDGRRLS